MPRTKTKNWIQQVKVAASEQWSGNIVLRSDQETVGSLILSKGRIAWAVCKYQPEDLGTFLWRIGKVSKVQLDSVREAYAANHGKRKLGALLEESGFIKRPMLRRCLLLHIRMAIGCLKRDKRLTAVMQPSDLNNDDYLSFSLAELTERSTLVPFRDEGTSSGIATPMLESLAVLDGYLASLVLDGDGSVVTFHRLDEEVDVDVVAVNVATLVDSTAALSRVARIGELNWSIVDSEEGALIAAWIDASKHLIAAVLLGREGNVGMAKYRLSAALEHILSGVEASSMCDMERRSSVQLQ